MPDVGDLIAGKYRLVRVIGRGGMGSVYEAEHTQLGKRVAIKVLHPEMAKNPQCRARFTREARAAARTGHRAVVEVHDIGTEADGSTFIVMELLEGQSLSERLKDKLTLPIGVAAHVACEVLSALHAVHESGILHRDIKPQNIFLVDGPGGLPKVKVLDFGVAKVEEGQSEDMRLTSTGASVGTPAYMAPEQAVGRRDLDRRVDVWSVGVVLYLTLTGRKPYLPNEVLIAVRVPNAPPTTIRSEIPIDLEKVILRALTIERDERYPTAKAMRLALLPFVGAGPDTGVTRPSGLPRVESSVVTTVWSGGADAYGEAASTGPAGDALPGSAGDDVPGPRPAPGASLSTDVGPYGFQQPPGQGEEDPPTIRRSDVGVKAAERERDIARLPPVDAEEVADMAVARTVKSPVVRRSQILTFQDRDSAPPTARSSPKALRKVAPGAAASLDFDGEDTAHESIPFGLRSDEGAPEPADADGREGRPDEIDERPTMPYDSSRPPAGLGVDQALPQPDPLAATAEAPEPLPGPATEPSGEISAEVLAPASSGEHASSPEWGRPADPSDQDAPPVEELRAKGRSWALPVAAAVVVLVGLGVLAVALMSREEPGGPADSAPGELAPPAVRTVVLEVKAMPAAARISLDGRPLPANPFRGELPRDESPHQLIVKAAGYQTYSEQLLLLDDRHFSISLKQLPDAGPGDGGGSRRGDAAAAGSQAKQAEVVLTSRPPSAKVYRGNTHICTTPCSPALPADAPLKLRIFKRGFQEMQLTVVPGRDKNILAKLRRN